MSTSTHICSNLLAAYKQLGAHLDDAKQARQVFQDQGTDEAYQALRDVLNVCEETNAVFLRDAQKSTEFYSRRCTTLERLALEAMEILLGRAPVTASNETQIIKIDVSFSASIRISDALSLITIFNQLQELECYNTEVTTLPKLPNSLLVLNCFGTPLKTLPKLPDFLQRLHCNNTKLTKLPELPDSLHWLDCGDNTLLKTLPKLPHSLELLMCSNTAIEILPELPDSLQQLNISETPAAKNPVVIAKLHEKFRPGEYPGKWIRK